MTLGQTPKEYSSAMKSGLNSNRSTKKSLLVQNMGATAIWTGICSKPGYSEKVTEILILLLDGIFN